MVQKKPKASPTEKLAQTLGAAPPPSAQAPATSPKVVQSKSQRNPIKAGVSATAGRDEKSSPETRPSTTGPAELTPGGAQVVAALVGQGYSYDEAVRMLAGDGRPGASDKARPDAGPSKEELAEIKRLSEGDDDHLAPVEDVEERFAVVEVSLEKREGFKTLIDDLWTRREEMEDVPKKTLYRVTFDISAPEFDWLLHRTIQEGQARKDAEYSVQRALMLLLKQQKALDPTRGGRRAFGGSGPREQYNSTTGGWTK